MLVLSIPISAALVICTIVFHYEVLRFLSARLPKMGAPVRFRILIVVASCFAAHVIEIWFYALAFALIDYLGWGTLAGAVEGRFADYLYFSVTSYSTLGFGDIAPGGALRLVSGVEALNGLFLIAWSTSFTYLAMERLWPLHTRVEAEKVDREARHK